MSEHVLRRAEIADRKKLTADPIRWSVLAVVGLFYLTYIIGADIETILASTHDDAAYYLQIARNLTDGNGLSFDTIHRTNGFHPLWLYCVLPLAVLFDDPQTLYRSVLLLQLGLVLVTGYLLATVLSRFTGRTGVLTGLGIFVFLVLRESLKGMETALSILLVVVLCWAVIHRRILDRGGKRDFLEMGLLMGAMVLARLDSIFIVPEGQRAQQNVCDKMPLEDTPVGEQSGVRSMQHYSAGQSGQGPLRVDPTAVFFESMQTVNELY